MYSDPWAMFVVRISPKIRVKPLATTKYSAASVTPLRTTVRKSTSAFGNEVRSLAYGVGLASASVASR